MNDAISVLSIIAGIIFFGIFCFAGYLISEKYLSSFDAACKKIGYEKAALSNREPFDYCIDKQNKYHFVVFEFNPYTSFAENATEISVGDVRTLK